MSGGTTRSGIWAALLAALLFGASTPFAKQLTGQMPAVLLAGLLYLGSGVGLWLVYRWRHYAVRRNGIISTRLSRQDLGWLSGAVALGGVAGKP